MTTHYDRLHVGRRRPKLYTIAATLLLFVSVLATSATGETATSPVDFTYKNTVHYEMDPYRVLFGRDPLGRARARLFEGYLSSSVEGMTRGSRAPVAWQALSIEEKTTFLSITAALHSLAAESGEDLLDWVVSLREIHGEYSVLNPGRYPDGKAFRLYVVLSKTALEHIQAGSSGTFYNTCSGTSFSYRRPTGWAHEDFCAPGRFDKHRKTNNHPNIQFNVSWDTGCADIDIDYRRGLTHFTRDNSNVLASGHTLKFLEEYCDPGFRVK